MREITPFSNAKELVQAIDNGGRFYNLFSHADDQVVTNAELSKAAGVFSSGDTAFLFLALAKCELPDNEHAIVEDSLEPTLRDRYRASRPKHLLPSAAASSGQAGDAMIITGFHRFLENKSQFSGFIMIPISSGSVTTFTMIPIFDQFDIYEVFDDKNLLKPCCVVATPQGAELPTPGPLRFAGILRDLQSESGDSLQKTYLEAAYFAQLADSR